MNNPRKSKDDRARKSEDDRYESQRTTRSKAKDERRGEGPPSRRPRQCTLSRHKPVASTTSTSERPQSDRFKRMAPDRPSTIGSCLKGKVAKRVRLTKSRAHSPEREKRRNEQGACGRQVFTCVSGQIPWQNDGRRVWARRNSPTTRG